MSNETKASAAGEPGAQVVSSTAERRGDVGQGTVGDRVPAASHVGNRVTAASHVDDRVPAASHVGDRVAAASHVDEAPASRPPRRRADLIARMTLEQKCALLSGAGEFTTRAYPELGIPSLRFSDGPNGVRKQAGASDHLGLNPSEPATCFPTACTVANGWDPELARREGAAMGEEAAAQGVNVLLGPGLNIKRSPLCGRNFEYYSEDPLLSGRMAAACVRGIQSRGVSACPKHFAVNSQETRRMASDSVVDERTMRELYLVGFEHAVREGEPRCLMTSYNLVNGIYANENEHLLKGVLRGEWGYEGAVVTDWGGSNDHAAGVAAGSTFEMPAPGGDSVRELVEAVRAGRVSQEALDDRVDEALELILSTNEAVASAGGGFDAEAHHRLAREIAAQCAVLLKNDGGLLPLAPATRVALVGDFANKPRYQGAGSSAVNATQVDSLLGLMGESGLDCVGYEPGFDRNGADDAALLDKAVTLAKQADVAVVCLGLTEIQESEGLDRRDMRINDNQVALLHAVSAANPNVVVLLSAGASVEVPWLADARSLLLLGLGGQAGAGAALDVLTGRVCPSGKLSETWPLRYADVPGSAAFPSTARTAEYREGLYVGYRHFDTVDAPVAFPFGYGLSYTTFAYSDVALGVPDKDGIPGEVSFVLTNTGEVAGAEVAQLYVEAPRRDVFGSVHQLAGFVKVELQPGESRRVAILPDARAFQYWNVRTDAWELEAGTYKLSVSASSRDVRLSCDVELAGTGAPAPYEGLDLEPYETGDVRAVDDATFERLLGYAIPSPRGRIDRSMTLGELGRGRSPIGWIAGAVLTHLYKRSLASNEPDLNVTFVYNMPLRALAKMTGGMVSMGMVDAIVMELRGFWVVGLVRLLVEFVLNQARNRRMA